MNPPRILITDEVHPVLTDGLRAAAFEVDYQPSIAYEEVIPIIGAYDGLVVNSKILCNKDFIDKAVRLQFIARLGSGREIIDLEYAAGRGIQTYFSPDGNNNAVAEHALGMLLALSNQLVQADWEVRHKIWEREARRGWELGGKTIGIIGFGYTGSQFARKLAGMDMKVLVHDKYLSGFQSQLPYILETSREEVLREADIISFHLPLSAETFHYCNDDLIGSCKQGVILINTSRGNVIDTKALVRGLTSGQVGGACLDVFENEKPNSFTSAEEQLYSTLYAMNQVILSPHIAGWTRESKYKMAFILLKKILHLYRSQGH